MAVNLKALLEETQVLQPNEVEDQTCHVCYEDYLKGTSREFPRKLPCSHVIGTECLLIWVSMQSHATSINCPWCIRPIVRSIHTQDLQAAVTANGEAILNYLDAQAVRVFTFVGEGLRERRWSWLALMFVLSLPAVCFKDSILALLPFCLLHGFTFAAMNLRIGARREAHPRRYVAVWVLDSWILTAVRTCAWLVPRVDGRDEDFYEFVVRIFGTFTWLELGVTLFIYLAHGWFGHAPGLVVAIEAAAELLWCL